MSLSLYRLLANGIHGASFVPDCDIYALGFQEVVALNPQSMLVEKSIAENNAPWERMVQSTLTDQYQLVTLHICISYRPPPIMMVSVIWVGVFTTISWCDVTGVHSACYHAVRS